MSNKVPKTYEHAEHDEKQRVESLTTSDRVLAVLDWLKTFLLIVLCGVVLTVFVLQRNTVSGFSMEPTLHHMDQIFVEKISKHFSLKRGDIVTLDTVDLQEEKGTLVIKRIIALPGESVVIRDGAVWIDGTLLAEPYLAPGTVTQTDEGRPFDQVTLAENEYFVLGDNRQVSKDSRRFGPVPEDHIIGKLLIRFYPFKNFGVPR